MPHGAKIQEAGSVLGDEDNTDINICHQGAR